MWGGGASGGADRGGGAWRTGAGVRVDGGAASARTGCVDLGEHRFKDFAAPVRVFQLGEGAFPPLKSSRTRTCRGRRARSSAGSGSWPRCSRGSRRGAAGDADRPGRAGQDAAGVARPRRSSSGASRTACSGWGLPPLRDPALVTESIAQTLGAKDGLAEHIGERELLLLLDNLEHVIEAAPELSRAARGRARTWLLVTSAASGCVSRARSSIRCRRSRSAEAVVAVLRARRRPTPEPTTITELCGRLDNLPLAVELAAARTSALARADPRAALAAPRPAQGRPRRRPAPADAESDHRVVLRPSRRPTSSGSSRPHRLRAAAARSRPPRRSPRPTSTPLQSLVDKSLLRRHERALLDARDDPRVRCRATRGSRRRAGPRRVARGLHGLCVREPLHGATYDSSDPTRVQAELPNLPAALEHALTRRHGATSAHRL